MSYRTLLLGAVLMVPATAFAAPSLKDIAPTGAYARGGVLNLSADGASFLKLDIAVGTTVTVVPDFITGKLELVFGPGRAGFTQGIGEGLSADTEWASDAFVSLLAGGRLTVFRRSWADVGVAFSFETTLFGGEMRSEKFIFSDDSGEYDISDFARKHAALNASYQKLNALVDVRVPIFDIWTAYVSGGITQFSFKLDLSIDKEAKEMIESIGQSPSAVAKNFDESYVVPVLNVGSDVDIPNVPIYLNAEVNLVPVSIEQLFLGASLSIGLRL